MDEETLGLRELVGLHVDEAAEALRLLGKSDWTLEAAREAVLDHYRKFSPGVVDAVLNEEPIYVAGHLLGLDGRQIDALPKETWAAYFSIKSKFDVWLEMGGAPNPAPDMPMFEPRRGYVLTKVERSHKPNP